MEDMTATQETVQLLDTLTLSTSLPSPSNFPTILRTTVASTSTFVRKQQEEILLTSVKLEPEETSVLVQSENIWDTNPIYDKALRDLYSPSSQVFLIFTIFMSGEFCGIAKMASGMMWIGERTIFDKSMLRQKFKLHWVACSRVPYDNVKAAIHEPVYKIIRRTGFELPPDIGSIIHKMLVENQLEAGPQSAAILETEANDINSFDTTTLNIGQEMTLGESNSGYQEEPALGLDSLFMETTNMDVDLSEGPTRAGFMDEETDDSSSMDMDTHLDAGNLIDFVPPEATPPSSPRVAKRSISADDNHDLSTEIELAREDQLTRGQFSEQLSTSQDVIKKESEEEMIPFFGKMASPPHQDDKFAELHDLSPKLLVSVSRWSPPRHQSSPRNRSPPPPRNRSPPPPRNRSPPPPRNRSPPPPRNRSPPPPRNRSPPPRRNHSPPPRRRFSPPPRRRSPPPPRGRFSPPPRYEQPRTPYFGFGSTLPFPQRSKDPRDRSSSSLTYIFHSGDDPNFKLNRANAPTDPRLSSNRSSPIVTVPQKRPFESEYQNKDSKDRVIEDIGLPVSVFPLEDDNDDGGLDGHYSPPHQTASSSAGPSSSSTAISDPSAEPPLQITSITLVPAGLSKSRRKKLRKEAMAKPLDF
ncbi:YTH domain-containing protein 1 [Linnemannia zychae]|nr:YTH domain-containing protein 1 [Linnemannia zychae]